MKKTKTLLKPSQPKFVIINDKTGKRKRVSLPQEIKGIREIEAFRKYSQLKYDWDNEVIVRKWESKNGKTYSLPCVNKRAIIAVLPEDEKQEFIELEKKARSATGKINGWRNKFLPPVREVDRRSLFDEYSSQILEMLGRGWTAQEVHAELLKQGVDIPYRTIFDYHTKNRAQVAELRNKFNEGINDVSLSNKRSRLERLNYLYHEVNQDFEKCNTPLLRGNLSRELRGIIEQARKEVEGENLKLTVEGNIDVNATLGAAIESNKLFYGLTIQQMVISRVAARLHLPSQYLIDRLAHSFYAKHNGYRTNEDLRTKPLYPTSVPYDILSEEMVKKNAQWEEKQKTLEISEPLEVIHSELVEEEKQEIKRRLREKLGLKKD